MPKTMCTKADIAEVVTDKIAPLVASIDRIEGQLEKMPCQDIMKKNIRLEVNVENLEKLRNADKLDIDKLYKASREASDMIATLKEQNKGQDNISGKMWFFIMLGINSVFMIAMYFLTRG